MKPNLWNIPTILFLVAGLLFLVTELTGVFTHWRPVDTASQTWWALRDAYPVVSRIGMGLFLGWLAYHFLWYDGRVYQPGVTQ